MYRAVELTRSDCDLHRFVWRSDHNALLTDYRMTRVTFGVSAPSFAAYMAEKQNAIDHAQEFPLAAEAARKCFYVDDCLMGADDPRSNNSYRACLLVVVSHSENGTPAIRLRWKKSQRNSETLAISKPSPKSMNKPKHSASNGTYQPMSSDSLLPKHYLRLP